jgi:hypothetical protein
MNHPPSVLLLVGVMVFFCSLADAQAQAESQEPLDVKLCDVTAHSEKYDNKLLRIHATVDSDGMHTTLLTDRKCATGIMLYNSDEAENFPENHRDVQALEGAIEQGRAGTLDKLIEGTFTGVFLVERKQGKIRRLMKLKAVADLKVSAKTNAK